MNFLRYLGRVKYRAIRVFAYVNIWTAFLVTLREGWHWWYVPALAGFFLLYLFETKYGISGELDVAWKNSREWQQFKKEFAELKQFIIERK